VRQAIAQDPDQWRVILKEPSFRSIYKQEGERLKRPPKGFDSDHPLIEELKRKSFVAFHSFQEEETFAPDFIDTFAGICARSADYMRFLTKAVGLPF
jgi:uncharacterized protein (TIGR02453 family)